MRHIRIHRMSWQSEQFLYRTWLQSNMSTRPCYPETGYWPGKCDKSIGRRRNILKFLSFLSARRCLRIPNPRMWIVALSVRHIKNLRHRWLRTLWMRESLPWLRLSRRLEMCCRCCRRSSTRINFCCRLSQEWVSFIHLNSDSNRNYWKYFLNFHSQ